MGKATPKKSLPAAAPAAATPAEKKPQVSAAAKRPAPVQESPKAKPAPAAQPSPKPKSPAAQSPSRQPHKRKPEDGADTSSGKKVKAAPVKKKRVPKGDKKQAAPEPFRAKRAKPAAPADKEEDLDDELPVHALKHELDADSDEDVADATEPLKLDAQTEQKIKTRVASAKKAKKAPKVDGISHLATASTLVQEAEAAEEERGVIYLGHIPFGFFEREMKSYFEQFGHVTRLRLSRNLKVITRRVVAPLTQCDRLGARAGTRSSSSRTATWRRLWPRPCTTTFSTAACSNVLPPVSHSLP